MNDYVFFEEGIIQKIRTEMNEDAEVLLDGASQLWRNLMRTLDELLKMQGRICKNNS